MASLKPLVLLLGAGANVGEAVAKKFEAAEYIVALASRKSEERQHSATRWSYKIDLDRPEEVGGLFAKISKDIGIPSVVIYNAAALTFPPGGHPFTVPVKDFGDNLNVNTVSVYAAAKAAVEGFEKLPSSTLKSFIYTGNALNTTVMPQLVTLGVGKSASAHIIQAGSVAYAEKDYHFYYVDERQPDGKPVGSAINGPAHADYFFNLAREGKQGPWLSTFVNGKGYVKF